MIALNGDLILKISSGALIVITLYEFYTRKRLEKIVRTNTWSLYRDASAILAGLQGLQKKIQGNQDVNYELGRLTGLAEDMMNNQIRQINVNEGITWGKIENWKKRKRICNESHIEEVFAKFAEK